jgi:hypothetical protein
MKVSKFIEWLKTQDQDAVVEVLVRESRGNGWEGDSFHFEELDPDKHADYVDFRGNQFAKGEPHENGRFLYLGDR